MADDFTYDVFLSNSAKDKQVVRDVVKRLWFDEGGIRPDSSIPANTEKEPNCTKGVNGIR